MHGNNFTYFTTTAYFADYSGATGDSIHGGAGGVVGSGNDNFAEFGSSNGSSGLNSTNGTNGLECPSTYMPIENIGFMILYTLVFIIGLMGNTLVIYVVLRFSNMQTVTNMYILNLAIADECYLIGIPFLIATMNMGQWVFGDAMCKAYMVSTSITQFTSSIFLFIMSADRYIAICHHVQSPTFRTPLVSRIVSVIAWCCSVLIMLPIMIYANVTETAPGRYTCAILWPESPNNLIPSQYAFTIYSLILGFAIPLCFIMTFYCMVIKKLSSVARKTNRPKNKRRSHRKVTKLVLTVITVYIFCWLPYWVAQVSLITSPVEMCGTRFKVMLFLLVCWLSYSNSAINPILYAYLSDNFKKSFLKACTCAATKDVNAQLKLENSGVGVKKMRDRRTSESTQPTCTTRCQKTCGTEVTTTVTTTTCTSNLPSRNDPSPPTAFRRTNGSIQSPSYYNKNSNETLNSTGELIVTTNGQRIV